MYHHNIPYFTGYVLQLILTGVLMNVWESGRVGRYSGIFDDRGTLAPTVIPLGVCGG